jgi:hypothetical protein
VTPSLIQLTPYPRKYVRTYTETHMSWPAIIADLDELTETEVGQNGRASCSDPSPNHCQPCTIPRRRER